MIEKYDNIILKFKKFRHSFFNSFYASLPEQCEQKLSSHIKLESGSQPPKSEHIYEYQDGYIRFIQNRDYSNENHKTYIKISKRNKVCSEYDIMIDKYGEAGTIRYGLAGAYNVALAKVIPLLNNSLEYIRDYLLQEKISEILYQSSQASTRPSLNESSFTGLNIKIPNKEQLFVYEQKMSKFLQLVLKYIENINKLKNIKLDLLKKYFG